MHGLHGYQLECFAGKSNNEIIVLLEEIIRNEVLNEKIKELTHTLEKTKNNAASFSSESFV